MMKITKKTEYGLIALRYMQELEDGTVANTTEIAETHQIPRELLAKAMQQMARSGFIQTINGARGGYKVKADFSTISMDFFLESMEGPLSLVLCTDDHDCPIQSSCNISKPLNAINAKMKLFFSNISLAEITS